MAGGAYRRSGRAAPSASEARRTDARPAADRSRPAAHEGGRVPRDSVELSATSPVRAEKVAQVRARIAEGYYERDEVKAVLSRRLLEQFGAEQ